MGSYWRTHSAGIDTIETTARWVQQQAEQQGLSLHDYVEGRVTLRELGVTSKEAAATLKPLLPCAHDYYNGWGGCPKKFETWEAWFSEKLRNRIFYFFHKHDADKNIVRAWAEWPLDIPPRAPQIGEVSGSESVEAPCLPQPSPPGWRSYMNAMLGLSAASQ